MLTIGARHELLPKGLELESLSIGAGRVTISVSSRATRCPCPSCGRDSSRAHSRYSRTVSDLPWHGVSVELEVRARRFFCDEASCQRRIFCERLPDVAARARKTDRLEGAFLAIVLELGGRAGARLAEELGLVVGRDALLSRAKRAAPVGAGEVKVLGIDDFAFRRGARYGTILVDLERRRVVDLLPERSQESLVAWLKRHPEVETATRDRSNIYREALTKGAPEATQVADRWHLLHNLALVLEEFLLQKGPALCEAAAPEAAPEDKSDGARRDVQGWQRSLVERDLAPSTVNNHLASLSAFTTWVDAQAPGLFPADDPAKGIKEVRLPPLEPRALSEAQVRSLKNVCDRLERFHGLKGREWKKRDGGTPVHTRGRPARDRAIVFVLLSTGLRREEMVVLDLEQVEPNEPEGLRNARRVRVRGVKGKGGTERNVFLSRDAREALAEYLETERPKDAVPDSEALFLSAAGTPARREDGRLSVRAVNLLLERIGRWHDAEVTDPARKISPLRPHDLRHTFAYRLSPATFRTWRSPPRSYAPRHLRPRRHLPRYRKPFRRAKDSRKGVFSKAA